MDARARQVADRLALLYYRSDKHVEVRSDGLKDRGSTPLASKWLSISNLCRRCRLSNNADKILRSLPKPPGAMGSEEILAEAIRRDQELESGALEPLTEEAFWAGARRGGA